MTDVASELEAYLEDVFAGRDGGVRIDFEADDVVAAIETEDRCLAAELRGAKFDVETDGDEILVHDYTGDASFAGVSAGAE